MVCDAVPPLGKLAVRVLMPTASPVTKPSYCPFSRSPNWPVTSRVPTRTSTFCGSVPGGNVTVTRASPPEIRSARLESTEIVGRAGAERAAPLLAIAGAARPVAASTTTRPRRARALFRATLDIPPECQFDGFARVPAHRRPRRWAVTTVTDVAQSSDRKEPATPGDPAVDPRRWFTLAIIITAVLIVVLDNTVLNVAIPTILRDFHTTLPALEWVVTGYALTFATLLIIGGRLADLYGSRRVFVIGTALFGIGSLLASVATSVPMLIVGEAIIEGIGASLMLPATLGILSRTFRGRERAAAFAAWGAVAGAAIAFGPILGGYLTTYHSWRWAFRINV